MFELISKVDCNLQSGLDGRSGQRLPPPPSHATAPHRAARVRQHARRMRSARALQGTGGQARCMPQGRTLGVAVTVSCLGIAPNLGSVGGDGRRGCSSGDAERQETEDSHIFYISH